MVLNEIYSRKTESGRIAYYNPVDVDSRIDDAGNRIGATLKADGLAGGLRRHRYDVEVQEQRRRSRRS